MAQSTVSRIIGEICNRRRNSDIRADDLEVRFELDKAFDALRGEISEMRARLNTPEVVDFMAGVPLEAAHQRERWGSDHDAGKTAADWFWLVGYLAGKALHSEASGNHEKALHHVITTAAALANWHSAILSKTNMRPGIMPPEAIEAPDPGA